MALGDLGRRSGRGPAPLDRARSAWAAAASLPRRLNAALNRLLPKRLFARSLLIIVVPMVLLQSVVTLVFMERHWSQVTERLSDGLVRDVAAVIGVIEAGQIGLAERVAASALGISMRILPSEPLPPPVPKPLVGLLDSSLATAIARDIGRPFWLDTVTRDDTISIIIKLDAANVHFIAPRGRAYARNSHIFLVWMLATAVLLIGVAVLFLRGQVRPIQMLADAAESFGRGRPPPDEFRPRGATEVRRAGLAFIQMRERIERQIAQRTTMLTGVSHDLRTVLTRLRLQLAVADDDELDPELKAEIERDLDDMGSMLAAYMDFARGEGEEDLGTLSLGELVARCLSEAGLRERHLEVRLSGADAVRVRPVAFTRLVMNLVSNACRHARGVRLSVRHADGRLVLTVEDNGPGIPDERIGDAFLPFVRLDDGEEDTARNQDFGGTGLGLTIARDIARSHGGDLRLDRSPDMGGLRATVSVPA